MRVRGWAVVSALVAASVSVSSAADRPLADAARRADWGVVRALVERGADVTERQGDGATALHWAAYWDEVELAGLLIEAGADVDAANDLGVTPLWAAAENGGAAMAQRLLDAGADPDVPLLSGETPLMTAARVGAADVAGLLLGAGADADATAGRSQTALMWAVSQRHPGVVEVLLAHGAAVDARTDVWTEMVKTTPEPWNPEYVAGIPQGGYTPLLFAARVGDLASAKLLVAAGADVDDQPPYGTSATVVAAHSGHRDVAAFLLAEGADPNAADAGYTALHAAILHKDAGLVGALLKHGADPDATVRSSTPVRRDAVDFYLHPSYVGATPFWLAARFNAPDIMRLLLARGADPLVAHHPTYWPGSLSIRDERVQVREGRTTALMAAAGLGGRDPLISVDRLARIAESAPVLSTRREPDPAAREAAMLDAVRLAAAQGIDVNAANGEGNTALHGAARAGHDSVVRFLVAQGARVDAANRVGQTPLALARRGRGRTPNHSTVELLRHLGAGE
ncbi:MAG: ankyrin repeat domain-containing protein [Acidobacteria bacterium]|nr:ankyrin repeat domain-containing protein [Acidobacteriota bacterium]